MGEKRKNKLQDCSMEDDTCLPHLNVSHVFLILELQNARVTANDKYTRCPSLLLWRPASEALIELCTVAGRGGDEKRGSMAAKVWATGMSFIVTGPHSSAFGTLLHFFIFILHLRGGGGEDILSEMLQPYNETYAGSLHQRNFGTDSRSLQKILIYVISNNKNKKKTCNKINDFTTPGFTR